MTILEQIKEKLDILDVVQKEVDVVKKGSGYWSICPFHQDENPSMSVSPQKQIFKCFTCNTGGDAIAFYSKFHKISFKEALAHFAKELGLSYKGYSKKTISLSEQQTKMIEVLKDAQAYFMNELFSDEGKEPFEYLINRKLNESELQKFQIGFSPNSDKLIKFLQKKGHENSTMMASGLIDTNQRTFFKDRIVFSIYDNDGNLVGFSGRKYKGDGPKYINSPDTELFKKSTILYGYNLAKGEINVTAKINICEGFMDVIAMHKMGYENSVAIMGTALSDSNLSLLSSSELNVILDGDNAGQSASMSIVKRVIEQRKTVYVSPLPKEKDVFDVWSEFGTIDGILKKKKTGVEFIVYKLINKYKDDGLGASQKVLDQLKKMTPFLTDIIVDAIASLVSKEMNIEKTLIFNELIKGGKQVKEPMPAKKKNYQGPRTNHPVEYGPAPEMIDKPLEVENNQNGNNWINKIIVTLLKHESLVSVFEHEEPRIMDNGALKIINSIINFHKSNIKIELTRELRDRFKEIYEKTEPVEEGNFKILLKRVHNDFVDKEYKRVNNEFLETRKPELADKLLEIIKLKKI